MRSRAVSTRFQVRRYRANLVPDHGEGAGIIELVSTSTSIASLTRQQRSERFVVSGADLSLQPIQRTVGLGIDESGVSETTILEHRVGVSGAAVVITANSQPPRAFLAKALDPFSSGRKKYAFATKICGRLMGEFPRSRLGLCSRDSSGDLAPPTSCQAGHWRWSATRYRRR